MLDDLGQKGQGGQKGSRDDRPLEQVKTLLSRKFLQK